LFVIREVAFKLSEITDKIYFLFFVQSTENIEKKSRKEKET
jgi:hypothetical protein